VTSLEALMGGSKLVVRMDVSFISHEVSTPDAKIHPACLGHLARYHQPGKIEPPWQRSGMAWLDR
jgi:hypothetical protein